MADLETIQRLVEEIHAGLFRKERLGASAKDDGAPPRKQPVAGFERAFGPKPAPSSHVEYAQWWAHVEKTDEVFSEPPNEDLAMAAAKLKYRGGPALVFLRHEGVVKAAVPPADSDPNFITPERLLESFEGLFINGKFYL